MILSKIGDLVQTADWKLEKHVPVIDSVDSVTTEEFFEVNVAIGKEIAHPNTIEHHISWVSLYFKPDGDKFPYQVGHYEFSAHGGLVSVHHAFSTCIKIGKSGILFAVSLCNIHGLWQSSKEINLK